MKVVHVSTYDIGGAGNAALRIHQSLLDKGVDSTFLCLHKLSNNANKIIQFDSRYTVKSSLFQKLLNRINAKPTIDYKLKKIFTRLESLFDTASSPYTPYRVHLHEVFNDADIVHLHWVSDFIDYPSFFKNIKVPIVWTLHDFYPDQGILHLKFDKQTQKNSILNRYENLISIYKRLYLDKATIFIVAPSKWFYNELKFNVLDINSRKAVIYHPIELKVFRPLAKNLCREVLSISNNKLVFICVASSFERKVKGFSAMIESFDKFYLTNDFVLLAIGNKATIERPYLKYVGNVQQEEFLALLYSASDAFISCSLEESFSLSAAEALACGTPVLATPVGFMADLIYNGFNGYLCNDLSSSSIYEMIIKFVENSHTFSQETISQFASENFSSEIVANKYWTLYDSVKA